MLRRLKTVQGLTLAATDGEVGRIHDFYLDDDAWTVRYLVVDTGVWLGRLVVISPIALGTPDWNSQTVPVDLSRAEIENSPDILSRPALTREVEAEYAAYYGYPFYWEGAGIWGWAGLPGALAAPPPTGYAPTVEVDPTLTSVYGANEIAGFHIHAVDGEIGHVDDFIAETDSWSVRYLQLDTSNWLGGRTVLLATRWVSRIDVADGKLHVDMTRDLIERAPEYDPSQPLDRAFEQRLHLHYGLPAYWETARARGKGTSGAGL